MDRALQIRSLTLFFFLNLDGDKKVVAATLKAMRLLRRKGNQITEADLIATAQRVLERSQKLALPTESSTSPVVIPPNLELGGWREFQKKADQNEVVAVVWSRVLRFSDEVVASGLNSTVGTVRHRVARGLRKLGSLIQ